MSVVLDASALLAYLQGEPGDEVVEEYRDGLKKDGLTTFQNFKLYVEDGSIDENVLKNDYGFRKFHAKDVVKKLSPKSSIMEKVTNIRSVM